MKFFKGVLMVFQHIYTEQERLLQTTLEKKRIAKLFKKVDKEKKNVVDNLVSNAAFMYVSLRELELIVQRDGYIEEYKNGANQTGKKKSAALEAYNNLITSYTKVVKQLVDLLPEGESNVAGKALLEFIKN